MAVEKYSPDYDHILFDKELRKMVYEPEADTFLMLTALETDVSHIRTVANPVMVLEVGCGAGISIEFLRYLLRESHPHVHYEVTDLNPAALRAALGTWSRNARAGDDRSLRAHLDATRSDLFTHLRGDAVGVYDVIIFNPPYVPTSDEELDDAVRAAKQAAATPESIAAAWAGGADGRRVIDVFLPSLPRLLSARGSCYMVALKENNIDGIVALAESLGLSTASIASRYTGEHLNIVRLTKH
jgi:release factor glutamine methyltransferase